MEHAPTVAVLHGEELVRKALARELREASPYALAAVVADPAAFKRAFALGTPPNAVVLSLETAMADDCAMLRWLLKHMPAARNLLCGPEPPLCDLVRSVRAGAHGFFCTRGKLALLCGTLASVCAGALIFPPAMESYLREHLPIPTEHTERKPTKRECDVLRLVGSPKGFTQVQIAGELRLSVVRVKKICSNLRKLHQVKGMNGLALLAQRLGVVDP